MILTKNVQRKVAKLYSKFQDINKITKKSRSSKTSRAMKGEFFRKLFHAALCKCEILCKCRCLMRRVPDAERENLTRDQRDRRKIALGALDRQETAERRRTASRRLALARNGGQAPRAPPTANRSYPVLEGRSVWLCKSTSEAGPPGLQSPMVSDLQARADNTKNVLRFLAQI